VSSTPAGNVVPFERSREVTFERMKGESRAAFSAFVAYRDAGPTRRINVVAAECKKSPSLLYRWSSRWHWQERADAFDAEMDRRLRAENLDRLREDARRHHAIAGLFLQKLVDRLKAVRPEDLPLSALPNYLDTAVKVQRLALGVASDSVELSGNPDRPLEVTVRFVRDWQLASEDT
jgi:hypothetical protein